MSSEKLERLIMNSPVQKIKERLSIEDVVSSYIKLEKAGSNLKAKCPFHNEKTPSFFVSVDRGSYYCFGCGAKGDIFTFVEEFEGLDFKGALKLLANRAGVILEQYNKEEESEKERLYRAMEESAKFFSQNLSKNQKALDYLKSRGLTDASIFDFKIGFAKDDWRELYNYLKSKNFIDKEIELAGLAKKSEKGYYDRFRGRIMFPISDSSGRIIAFSGRLFEESNRQDLLNKQVLPVAAKYLNSPDTPIFKKSSILYGIDKAKDHIRKNNFSIIVEGQFDLILSHQAGFKNTVATSGTALVGSDKSEDSIINSFGLLKRLSDNIVFVFDSDNAGFNASLRASPIALALFNDMNVKAAQVPDGMDPADLISKTGVDAWKKVIKGSKYIIEFLMDRSITIFKSNDILKNKLEVAEKIIPILNYIQNPIKRAHFMSVISNKSGIGESEIRDLANSKLKNNQADDKIIENSYKIFRKDYIERRLLGIVFWQKTLKESKLDIENLLKEFSEILKIKAENILEKTKDNKEDLIFEAEVFYADDTDIKKDVLELLDNLKEEYLKEELANKMQELNVYETSKEKDKSSQILKEINEINNKIQSIKNSRIKK
ncbi:MAG: DNA primase [Candidatus Woesebacteria bacterium]|nr:DNA primase [Candidatus Woesebacteria bacterium]